MRPSSHVSDDRLVEVCLEQAPTDSEAAHLTACDRCRTRRARLEAMFMDIHDAASAEADEIFPPERLAAQQARILQRIEQDGRPARVIAFPAAPAAELRPLRTRPAGRWIAGAAAAGLTIGLLAGHLVHDLPTLGRPSRPTLVSNSARATASPSPRPAAEIVNASFNEEEFLGEIENALDGPHVPALRPLNDLTPR
jgi:anti-sigma factor RsiW